MKKLLLIFALPMLVLAGCVTDNFEDADSATDPVSDVNPYAVSIDEALNEMYSLMDAIYSLNTRASRLEIASIETLKGRSIGGRTRSGDALPENLCYSVNFANDGGFAILGADTRVEPVYCIVEDGNFTVAEMEKIGQELINPVSITQPRFMTYEEMHYADPDNADVPFDIADYVSDDEDDEGGVWVVEPAEGDAFAKEMIVDMMLSETLDNEPVAETRRAARPVVTYSNWIDFERYGPFLTTKRWHQRAPFNNDCPTKSGAKAPAGCVAIALAQCVAYRAWPAPSKISGGITSTWDELKGYNPATYSRMTKTATQLRIEGDLAKLLHAIGKGVKMDYGKNGSSSNAAKAKSYWKNKLKYNPVKKYNSYKEDAIRYMLKNRRPVFICGSSGSGGHAWVIDGSLTQKRTKGTQAGRTTEYRSFIHYDFGWGGSCNGYYKWGKDNVDLTNGPVLPVTGNDIEGTSKTKYTKYFRTIEWK